MLFQRYPHYDDYDFTARKQAAYRRKLLKEQGKYPLFADLVASEQLSVEEEGARRLLLARQSLEQWRSFEARIWREARAAYFALSDERKAIVREQWAKWWGGRKAQYFWYVVRKYGLDHFEHS
jgi:hypothetical protein